MMMKRLVQIAIGAGGLLACVAFYAGCRNHPLVRDFFSIRAPGAACHAARPFSDNGLSFIGAASFALIAHALLTTNNKDRRSLSFWWAATCIVTEFLQHPFVRDAIGRHAELAFLSFGTFDNMDWISSTAGVGLAHAVDTLTHSVGHVAQRT